MKNKRFTIGLALLIAGSLAFTSCTKGKTNKAPEPDKELDSSTDAAKVMNLLTDMMEICAQGCDAGNTNLTFYNSAGVSPVNPSTISISGASNGPKSFVVSFNNTKGMDGKTRYGSFSFDGSSTPTSLGNTSYRDPQWRCSVTTTTANPYIVDGYTVQINPGMVVMNTTATSFTTSHTNLTWSMSGIDLVVFKPASEGGGFFKIQGTLNKELTNTWSANTFTATGGYPINWKNGLVNFTGKFEGQLTTLAKYTLTIPTETPLFRNYPGCTPEPLIDSQSHPIVSGVMWLDFPPSSTRQIDYGASTCDHNVSITIEGITYQKDAN